MAYRCYHAKNSRNNLDFIGALCYSDYPKKILLTHGWDEPEKYLLDIDGTVVLAPVQSFDSSTITIIGSNIRIVRTKSELERKFKVELEEEERGDFSRGVIK